VAVAIMARALTRPAVNDPPRLDSGLKAGPLPSAGVGEPGIEPLLFQQLFRIGPATKSVNREQWSMPVFTKATSPAAPK
jgi:hypothetical protein